MTSTCQNNSPISSGASTPAAAAPNPLSLNDIAARLEALRNGAQLEQPSDAAPQPSMNRSAPAAAKPASPLNTASLPSAPKSAEPRAAASAVSPVSRVTRPMTEPVAPDDLHSSKIMIVDDEEVNVLTVRHLLKKGGFTRFVSTTRSTEAIEMLRREHPDILLLDINMPDVNGLDILRALKLDHTNEHLPILILTANSDPAVKRQALELGASDFLPKPVDANDLVPRVSNSLSLKKYIDQIASQANRLEELVRRRTAELFQSRQQLILSLARAAEHRDNETGNHVIRVGRFAGIIASEIGWSEEMCQMIEQAAQLHDVGKIGVPDSILFKPGKLEPREFDLIKRHCAMGRDIIEPFSERDFQILKTHARIGESILHVRNSPMLLMASRIAQTHHENWDGTGYPLGLAGEDIPLEGRITAIADVYDALSSRRPYKEPFSREKCFEILEEGREKKFDPQLLDAFYARTSEIVDTQLALMDRETNMIRQGE